MSKDAQDVNASPRWSGRTMHFVGVGGAGMSGYARVAHELGARVSGSDRAGSPYLEQLRDDAVLVARIGHDAENVPAGSNVEVVYSSAVPQDNPERLEARARGLRERSRADLLAELSALKRTVAVAGSHGKTTTSSMLVRALEGAGMEPGWVVGGTVGPGLPNARWGAGEWLVIEADESDRSMLELETAIAVLTSVELDHPDAFGSLAELREAFRELLARAPQAVVWDRPELLALRAGPVEPYDVGELVLDAEGSRFHWRGHEVRLVVPGAHNAANAAGALEAARLAGASEVRAAEALASFRGAGRRFQELGETVRGAIVYDDYAHHPSEVAATLRAARVKVLGRGRLVAVFQPHLYSRTAALAREFGQALAGADVVVVLDVYPARERAEEHPGVSGLTIAEAVTEAAPGRPVYWLPTFASAQPVLQELLGAEDICVVMGAGDVDRARAPPPRRRGAGMSPGEASAPPRGVQRDVPLARFATIRTGGPAELFARADAPERLVELLAWAHEQQISVAVLGSGSNVLIADDGVRGLVLKLEGALAEVVLDDTRIVCGAAARLPAVATKAARAGLTGIEFGVNIPGTVGGAVRMNAGAYGGELAGVLEWVDIATADGLRRRAPEELGLAYRRSALEPSEVVARASFALAPAPPQSVKQTLAEMRSARREAQPSGIRTFGSTFKNPDDAEAGSRTAGELLAAAGCNGLQHGRARFSPKHANFVENTGGASTADVVALMAEGRRRVLERFGVALEPEVQLLGAVRFPW